MFEYDYLKIQFLKDENSFEIMEKETCVEHKSDIYIPPKEKKISERKINRRKKN